MGGVLEAADLLQEDDIETAKSYDALDPQPRAGAMGPAEGCTSGAAQGT